MSILTPFFNLFKPSKADGVKVAEFNANMDIIDTEMHRPPLTVNGVLPNETTRDIYLESVPLADNLSSDDAQFEVGTFLVRTSGGDASIADGAASLSTIKGSMVKTGYVAEVIEMTVNAVPRVAPPAITATLDAETFEAYVETAGTYTLSYTTEWSASPALYGVTVSNTPVSGDEIVITWDGENEPEMVVNAVARPVPAAITATINKATFRAYVSQSGTVTLSYTTAWSANPALYGITVSNTPVSGDSIVVEYVKENRGTITTANVSVFNSTGWNLFQTAQSYARVVRYSETYGYKIGGSYSLVNFATTPTGTSTAVNVDANGYFNVPEDGYVIVTGADATTYIYATWSDWTEGYEGEFQEYTVDSIDLSEIMVNFVAGLCAIGDVRDEINFNTQKAISRIQRMEYTDANLAAVIVSGRPYDTDTNYIYVVRETYEETGFSLDPTYTVSDHGLEFYTASTNVPPVTETIYGNNLKDKLRTDVLTISQQTLSSSQQAQVRENIGAFSQDDGDAINSKFDARVQSGTDLNNLTTPGFYGVINGTVAGSLINSPITNTSFAIIVQRKSDTYISQLAYSGDRFYMRAQYSSGFQPWSELALNSNLATQQATVTLQTGVTNLFFHCRKSGNVVTLNGALVLSGEIAGANYGVAALPTGFRPSSERQIVVYTTYAGNTGMYHFTIQPGGSIITNVGGSKVSGTILFSCAFCI